MIGDYTPSGCACYRLDLSSKLTRIYCSTIAVANQGLKGGPPSMTSINEETEAEEDDYDEKDVTIEVAIQKPIPVATSLPVYRV